MGGLACGTRLLNELAGNVELALELVPLCTLGANHHLLNEWLSRLGELADHGLVDRHLTPTKEG